MYSDGSQWLFKKENPWPGGESKVWEPTCARTIRDGMYAPHIGVDLWNGERMVTMSFEAKAAQAHQKYMDIFQGPFLLSVRMTVRVDIIA